MMPNNALSTTALPAAFLPPRTGIRFGAVEGASDVHYGGVAISNNSLGDQYQVWNATCDGENISLSAPNTPEYVFLPNVGAVWVALAFDQNANIFLAWVTAGNVGSYYWYDSTIPGYRTSTLSSPITRIFAALDDARPQESTKSDILLCYEKADGNLYMRQQRDRYGVEYELGAAPSGAALVQIGMNVANRFQFAFQNVQGTSAVPPAEFQQNVGGVINVA